MIIYFAHHAQAPHSTSWHERAALSYAVVSGNNMTTYTCTTLQDEVYVKGLLQEVVKLKDC
jgi:hypothetical protein